MNTQVWLYALITSVLSFQIVSIPGLLLKRNDFADVLWGPSFAISSWLALYFAHGTFDIRSILILTAVTIWALRLFWHVGLRNLSHPTEDVRYNNWRKQWGKTEVWRSYLQVFVLQAIIQFAFLTSILLALSSESKDLGALAYLGIALWLGGFILESVADEQLRRFKMDPANKGVLMTRGVWSWSRHPNYFGEVVQWWGIWVMVLELPHGWMTIVSPIGITLLILKVSGVDMLEDLMKNRPGFAEYARKTSRFVPLPPKN